MCLRMVKTGCPLKALSPQPFTVSRVTILPSSTQGHGGLEMPRESKQQKSRGQRESLLISPNSRALAQKPSPVEPIFSSLSLPITSLVHYTPSLLFCSDVSLAFPFYFSFTVTSPYPALVSSCLIYFLTLHADDPVSGVCRLQYIQHSRQENPP